MRSLLRSLVLAITLIMATGCGQAPNAAGAFILGAVPPVTPPEFGTLLWDTDFEGGATFGPPSAYNGSTATVPISFTGDPFPAAFSDTFNQYSTATNGVTLSGANYANYFLNEIITPPGGVGPSVGHAGSPTKKIWHQRFTRPGGETQHQDASNPVQMATMLHPKVAYNINRPIYQREWIYFPSDLYSRVIPNSQSDGVWTNWFVVWEYKTGTIVGNWGNNGDFRTSMNINSGSADGGSTTKFWNTFVDEDGNGGYGPLPGSWDDDDLGGTSFDPPAGQWVLFEVYIKHGNSGGFIKAAVNGTLIMNSAGRRTSGVDNSPINRWFMTNVYSGGFVPWDIWIDSMEMWVDGLPSDASPVLN